MRTTARAVWHGAALLAAACTTDAAAPRDDPAAIADGPHVLVGAGDIASCGSVGDEATGALLEDTPGTVFTLGDNVYPDGSSEAYADCYHGSWGRVRARTRPVPGNHDYATPGAAAYFQYFGQAAGAAGRGYYSYDLGAWHVIALNSEVPMDVSSDQLRWLRDDLAGSDARCTVAYWHEPLFSSSAEHPGSQRSRAAWDALYAAGAEIVVNGHAHLYERFAPQSPDGDARPATGIRQFVVGTGGVGHHGFGAVQPHSEARDTTSFGVLRLTLRPDGYDWRFVPVDGAGFTDAGYGTCH